MKKYLFLIFYLFCFHSVFAQKNNIQIGMSAFNYFDKLGFNASETLKLSSTTIDRRLLNSIFLGFERSINDKSSVALFYNGFDHTYQKSEPYHIGLKSRAFFEFDSDREEF